MSDNVEFARQVAEVICGVNMLAGSPVGTLDLSETSFQERVENLLRDGPYKAYIIPGDPLEWGGGKAKVTILMEAKGGEGDCHLPMSYYGNQDVAYMASSRLPGRHVIEFINPAVACVFAG